MTNSSGIPAEETLEQTQGSNNTPQSVEVPPDGDETQDKSINPDGAHKALKAERAARKALEKDLKAARASLADLEESSTSTHNKLKNMQDVFITHEMDRLGYNPLILRMADDITWINEDGSINVDELKTTAQHLMSDITGGHGLVVDSVGNEASLPSRSWSDAFNTLT